MPNQDPLETSSLFSLREIRGRMKEKKNGALRMTKTNASIAAKLKTKAINNSSIIKITLKQNNKALALALTAAQSKARELTKEKMLLQKEVKRGDFERARLRQKLATLVNLFVRMHHNHNTYMEELQQLMNIQLPAVVKLSSSSERNSCSLLPSDERFSTADMTDSQADDNNCPIRILQKATRIPPFHNDDNKCENGTGDGASTSQPVLPLQLPTLAMGEPLKSVTGPAVEKPSSSSLPDEPLASSEKNGQPSGEVGGTARGLDSDAVGGNSSTIPQSFQSCSVSTLNNHDLERCSEITELHQDKPGLSLGFVTQRRKHVKGFPPSFRECSWMELSKNEPLAALTPPKETEPVEISQFVTVRAQNKSCKKIKASEAEAPKKISMGVKGTDASTSKSKGNLGDCNERAAPSTRPLEALGSNTTVSKSTEISAQVDCPEKIHPLSIHGQASQRFHKALGLSSIRATSPYVEDSSFSENCSSTVECTSQSPDKARACKKISAVGLAPQKGKTGIQETKIKAQVMELDPLSRCQSLNSLSLLGSPPPALPVLLDDALSDGECRQRSKTIPPIQRFSTIQNTALLKTNSRSFDKKCCRVRSQVTDFKREDPKPKANRKAHTENSVVDLPLDSHHVSETAEGRKIPARSRALAKEPTVVNKNANWVPSGRQTATQETPEVSCPNTAPHLNENKILKDLTNTAQILCHSALSEEPVTCRSARARKPVNYEEPKLNRKLRRGDPFANSDFFSCCIYKTRKKKTKSKAISKESSSEPVS